MPVTLTSTRTHLNFHLIEPQNRYRADAERQIAAANCRTRTDSVRLVETLITCSPEFFKGKGEKAIRAYFQHALDFLMQKQRPETFVSAVVHLDEKTPHMHVTFVPLTKKRQKIEAIPDGVNTFNAKGKAEELDAAKRGSIHEKLEQAKLQREYKQAVALLDRIPPEIREMYARPSPGQGVARIDPR